jgi:subtilase family serine protease
VRNAGRVSVFAVGALAAGLVAAGVVPASPRPSPAEHPPPTKHRAATGVYLTESQCLATRSIRLPCYGPAQLQAAYEVGPLLSRGIDGTGVTIAIVDSFGSPTIRKDLATFDGKFHLPSPPSLRVIAPAGAVPRYNPRTTTMVGWAGETTLDVEWAHSMAPGASILLVETPVAETEGTAGFPQIVAAENYVVGHHLAEIISQSFGANEHTFSSVGALESRRGVFVAAAEKDVTVVAAAGDTGATDYTTPTASTFSTQPAVTWPASDPLVTGVGGTELSLDAAGKRTAPDRAWNDTYNPRVNDFVFGTSNPHPDATGGGLSSIFTRPSFQNGVEGVVGDQRGIPDISMSAACSGLVDTYQSFAPTPPGWYYVCGTSEATPLFAGIVALADQEAHHPLGCINPALYAMAQAHDPGIVPVTTGNNTVSFFQDGKEHTVAGYSAGNGYDLVAGVGTVDAAKFVPELVRTVASIGTAVTYGFQGTATPG